MKPEVTITYCTLCNWTLRSGWMAQELLSTFGEDLEAVKLVPQRGGIFTIEVDGLVVWDRKTDGGFPSAKEHKRRVRDRAWPDRDMGHVDA